jgi:hypothetical protein
MDAGGSNPTPLTRDYSYGKMLPSLLIGGDSIIFFSRAVDLNTKQLLPGNTFFQMDSDGQNMRRALAASDVAFAAASANQDWVVYKAN